MRRTRHPWVGAFALVEAFVIALVVLRVLPARVPSIDVPLLGIALALVVAAVGLFAGAGFAPTLALAVLSSTLVAGLAVLGVLVLAAAQVSGLFGSIGEGIALLFVVGVFLVVPYLVALPSAQIFFLLRARGRDRGANVPARAA